jgi:hypothetical protein
MDWSGLELTGENNLVDGWWTTVTLSYWQTRSFLSRKTPSQL